MLVPTPRKLTTRTVIAIPFPLGADGGLVCVYAGRDQKGGGFVGAWVREKTKLVKGRCFD